MTLLEQELFKELKIRDKQEKEKLELFNQVLQELRSLDKRLTGLEAVFKEQTLIQQEFQNSLMDLEERLISLESCHLTLSQELVGLKGKLETYSS
ncbi:hypothetical protein ACHJH3_10715 [Campylobacter sp. MOP7]|uniref:hypothetical protein n=1 Tax=Campylobacter canis TaxID=3378588 RepID=UPI00387EBF58